MGVALVVKAFDGPAWWPQIELAVALGKQTGVPVYAWGYVYGQDPAGEAAVIRRAEGLTGYCVIDAEIQFQCARGDSMAAQILSSLKDLRAHLGLTSFAFPALHATFPWSMWASGVSSLWPQVYWQVEGLAVDLALERSYAQFSGYGLPIVAIGQAYGPAKPQDLLAFAQRAQELHLAGTSWWEWFHATPEQLAAIGRTKGV